MAQPTPPATGSTSPRATPVIVYLGLGILFGITLVKSEVVSWFRIQEMFRFHAFHMYGVILSAIAVAAASLAILRSLDIRASDGSPFAIEPKVLGSGYRYWIGGGLFGIGWALTGACPGPLFALAGSGVTTYALHPGVVASDIWRRLPRPRRRR